MKMRQSFSLYFAVFASLVFLDRITKALILWSGVTYYRVTPFLSFQLSFNRGISWGLFHSYETVPFVAITVLTIAIIIPLSIYSYMRWKKGVSIWGETIALAGALSNLIDRIFYGGVLDFISLSYRSWSWPIFNIADACIVFGVFLIFIGFYKEA